VLPSGWSCLGLPRHLALDDERFWFRGIITGEQTVIEQVAKGFDDARRVDPDVPVVAVFDIYRQEIDLSTAIITATPLDADPPGSPKSSSATGASTISGRSSCTCLPRPRSTPDTSMRHVSSSTAGPGLF
jgi:Protein of unknown function (DUF664)